MPKGTSALSSTRGIAPRLAESNVVPIPAGEHGPSANDVLRRFNRDTTCLAVGLLSILLLAALALAVLPLQPHRAMHGLAGRVSQAKSTTSLAEDAAVLSRIVDTESSASEVTSKTSPHVDQGVTGTSSKERVAPTEAAGPTTAPILLPEPAPNIATANVDNRSPAQRKEAARAFRAKRRSNSSYALTDADVKNRLIELWHQSLARTEKPQSWSQFSKLDRKKKAALIARK